MQVVPILAQRADAVRRYIEETGLPFDILIDESREVAKAYGVWHRVGLDAWNIARPAVFLIDREGRIRYSFIAKQQDEYPTHEQIMDAIVNCRSSIADRRLILTIDYFRSSIDD